MPSSAAAHLPVLGAGNPALPEGNSTLVDVILPPDKEADTIPVEEQLRAAHECGAAEGRVAADADFSQRLAVREAEFAAELDAQRVQLQREFATDVSSMITKAFEDLEARVSASASRALEHVVEDGVRAAMVCAFAQTLRELWDENPQGVLKITGPEMFLSGLRTALGDLADRIEFAEQDIAEAFVTLGQTRLETRFSDWMAQLRKVREDA